MAAAIEPGTPVTTEDTPKPATRGRAAAKPAAKGKYLRYTADRRPVAVTLALLSLHFVAFFVAPTWLAVALVVPFSIASFFIAPLNHHHQHFNSFHSPILNRIYEVALSLQTGLSPFGWVLHHNLGHHKNYLNQHPSDGPIDESRWTRRDGSTMNRVEYTIKLVAMHQIDIYRVGQKHPKQWRNYLLMKIPVWSILGALLWINPVNAFLVFLLPAFVALCHTSWATYEHHAGYHATDHHDASVNRTSRVYNYLTCNLGYHTAHHKRPGLHWSLLEKLHHEIEDQIPADMVIPTFFGR
ncbi:MAG: fatty acid desaturase [bacterium]|nr:fatty acid desaturase [bacterium]